MIQVAFLRKAEMPTKKQIQDTIQDMGYDFKILGDLDDQIDQDGIESMINGHRTCFETDLDNANTVVTEANWLKPDITDQDTAISFVWGADFAAGACIGLVSIALIDLSNALVYYMDDQMKYTREMLVADTPQFLEELKKQNLKTNVSKKLSVSDQKTSQNKKSFFVQLKELFK